MITVTNYDKNGNLIPDLSKVTIDLSEWPVLVREIRRIEEKMAAEKNEPVSA